MATDPSVLELLEEVLDSGRSPEEVCRDCPDLLPKVHEFWRRHRSIQAQVATLFPASESVPDGSAPSLSGPATALPVIPGYEIQALLGHGGMGVVYKAWHLGLQRPVALKMLLTGIYASSEERDRLLREAKAAAALRHANIVQVYEVGDLGGRTYFTMEFVDGGSLAQQLTNGPHTARQAAEIVAILAEAVEVAHRGGIVHRDLKPGNVLLAADGTPKIADFGLARRLDGGEALTRTGAAIGTPSYMAPEQAQAKKSAVGPAVDVYALGAILYELLTGQPPFQGEASAETLLKVISDEPAAPSRLTPRVPRDLETICLKCLQKEPQRRYTSAAALADDLRRFERGEPIAARPVGPLERGLRWLWRRPALGAALAATVLLALSLTGVGLRWYLQRSATMHAAIADAEEELRDAQGLQKRSEFVNAAAALRRAKLRLGDEGPSELHDRLDLASRNLELVTRLDAIRLDRVLTVPLLELNGPRATLRTKDPDAGQVAVRRTLASQKYEAAFRGAGLGSSHDDPAVVAARVTRSPDRAALLDALDDWAACAVDRDQLTWVVAVARLADPDPWRDRVRAPATWLDRGTLYHLAATAPVAQQSPQLLVLLAARLQASGGDATGFLTRVVLAHPNHFWSNVELGNSLSQTAPLEAIGYFRTALVIRPETALVHAQLGGLYLRFQRLVEATNHLEHAARLAPSEPWTHRALGVALFWNKRWDAGAQQIEEAIRLDPNYADAHRDLGFALKAGNRLDEATEEYANAYRLYVNDEGNSIGVQRVLMSMGRGAELRLAWKKKLAANPPEHDAWFGYAELCMFLGEEDEYRRARRDLLARFGNSTDSKVAERTSRACLLLPASEDELRQAAALANRAVDARDPKYLGSSPYFVFAKGLAEYRLGHFDSAIAVMKGEAAKVKGPAPQLVLAMAQHRAGQSDRARKTLTAAVLSFHWSAANADQRDPAWVVHVLRREAEALILPNLPAFLEGKYQPRDNDERLALLGICQFKDLRDTEANLYTAAFAADPKLAEDLHLGCRYRAACAAAVAGCGGGADGARLSEEERVRWRKQAREWLRADLDAWAKKLRVDTPAVRTEVEQSLARWRSDASLAGLRDREALDKMSALERQDCRLLWDGVDGLYKRAEKAK